MTEKDFYELCYDQFKSESAQADAIYQRTGVLLAVLPILGAVAYKLGRPELITATFERVDTFFYIFASCGAFVSLAVSVAFMLYSLCPRSSYVSLASMKEWEAWRQDCRKYMESSGGSEDGNSEEMIGRETMREMIPKLADAQEVSSTINEKRRKAFKRSFILAGVGIACIGVQALIHLLLHLQGV